VKKGEKVKKVKKGEKGKKVKRGVVDNVGHQIFLLVPWQ